MLKVKYFSPHNLICMNTTCPRINIPFYIVTYYMKWATTSLTYSRSFYNRIVTKREYGRGANFPIFQAIYMRCTSHAYFSKSM